jgi:hypothetical protein
MKTMSKWAFAWMFVLAAALPMQAAEAKQRRDSLYQKTLRATAMIVSKQGL